MSGFKIRGFKEPASIPEGPTSTEESNPTAASPSSEGSIKKKRGPYKKRDKAAEDLAAMTPLDRLEFALKDFPEAPGRIQLDEWKDIHGTFFFSSVDKVKIYIWKTIKRTEYKNVLTSGALDKAGALEEFIVRRCLLWPKPDQEWMKNVEAGVIQTLFKQIYYQSGFIPEEEALRMIEKI